jgi:hypothetical protein
MDIKLDLNQSSILLSGAAQQGAATELAFGLVFSLVCSLAMD